MTTLQALQPLPATPARWAAVAGHDPAADGRFVYAVRTTGIYCRPSCRSRRPRRENVAYYPTPAAAAAGGFRPCRRCRPDAADSSALPRGAAEAVGRAVAYLQKEPGVVPPLAEVAAAAGLSPGHLQRTFSRLVGVSPRAYAQALRRERFKAALRGGKSVSRAGWDAGYGSSRQVYEQGADALGMTPAAYRAGGAGVVIRHTVVETAAGRLLLAATERGLCAAAFGGDDAEFAAYLAAEFPGATLQRDDRTLASLAAAVRRHLKEGASLARVELDIGGTPFERAVWNRLRAIPYGETRTYAEVAAAIGKPGAARAVGAACGANPVALVIPCHRVVRADGQGGGYRWGPDRKKALLALEAGGQIAGQVRSM